LVPPQRQQESLSLAYIRAVAADAGFVCSRSEDDYGIDLTICRVKARTDPETGKKRYLKVGMPLEIQAKSTTRALFNEREVLYDLKVKAYNDLRDEDAVTPCILVVHVQPPEEHARLMHSEAALVLSGCCYWLSFQGRPKISNARTTRIHIPRDHVFGPDELKEIMGRIQRREPL
jgi:hypothetical protein